MSAIDMNEYATLVGTEVGVSRWFEIDQTRIDKFADVTEDWQFIHLDSARAAKTAFGGTVAHGFLTLSMLTAMAYDGLPDIKNLVMGVNYGFDRIRFGSPVRSGSRVRASFRLMELSTLGEKEFMAKSEVVVELEGSDKPALVAEWLGIYSLAETVAC